jgi:NADH-quinone oxidoreductase subunit E
MNSESKLKGSFQIGESGGTDVVVIDDDESMCEGCRQTLESGGFSAAKASNGEDGIKLVQQIKPHVVLVDLKMPGMPGIEVMSKIPKIDSSIVTVVITGYGTIDAAVESMKIGAFDFLTKPFDPDKLLETVRRGIKLSEIRKAPTFKIAPPAAAPVPATGKPIVKKLGKQEILLEGIDLLSHSYEAGLERQDLLNELRYLESEAKYHAGNLGQVKKREKSLLDIANHFKIVDEIVAKYDYRKNALIQILLDLQVKLNWLPRHALKWLSSRLDVPLAKIYSVANFYEALSLEPRGAHTVSVCLGTACHVRGGPDLLAKISAILGIKPGETDSRQLFTLKTVNCLGCCALAPVMQIDGNYYSNPSLTEMKKIFESYATKEEAAVCLN